MHSDLRNWRCIVLCLFPYWSTGLGSPHQVRPTRKSIGEDTHIRTGKMVKLKNKNKSLTSLWPFWRRIIQARDEYREECTNLRPKLQIFGRIYIHFRCIMAEIWVPYNWLLTHAWLILYTSENIKNLYFYQLMGGGSTSELFNIHNNW